MGNVVELSDRHMLELHSPLTKAPLFVNLVVKWEQLLGISKPVQGKRSETYIAVSLEVYGVPPDTFGDFLYQLASGQGIEQCHLIVGGEPSMYLLAMR